MEVLLMSIVGWVITIGIAIYTARSSAKDTAKQIASIKELSRIQIEASIKQVELEIEKNLLLATQAKQEWEGIRSIKEDGLPQMEWRNMVMQDFHDKKPERDYELYSKFIKDLKAIKNGLEANKKKLD